MNKPLSILFLALAFTAGLSAQRAVLPEIYETAEEMATHYALSSEQLPALERIIEARNENLAAVAELRQSDEVRFWTKRKAIYQGQQAALERLLNTEQQQQLFKAQRIADRRAESELLKALVAEGKPRAEAKMLMLAQRY